MEKRKQVELIKRIELYIYNASASRRRAKMLGLNVLQALPYETIRPLSSECSGFRKHMSYGNGTACTHCDTGRYVASLSLLPNGQRAGGTLHQIVLLRRLDDMWQGHVEAYLDRMYFSVASIYRAAQAR